jgi:hypothetical protein
MEVVATMPPVALVESMPFGMEEMARDVVVADASVVLPPKTFGPVVVKAPATVEDPCERKPVVKVCSWAQEFAEARSDAVEARQVPPIA